jgi:O-antigen/teichoic acid export membrane protein
MWYPDITMLAVAVVALTAFEMVLGWGYVLYRYPAVRPRLHHFQLATLSSIMGFSFYVFLLALGGQLAFQTTALVIGRWMTTADVVTFAIPNSLMLILLQFVGGISSVIMPMATNLHTRGETRALRDILFKWTKIAMALAWCVGFFLLVFGPAFLEFWVKKGYTAESGSVLRILMVSYLVLVPVRGVAVPMLMGIGEAKWLTIATLAAGVLNLILSVLWVGPYGLYGAAWATFVPNVLLAAAMTWLVCRTLNVRVIDYVSATVPLALLGGFAGLAILEWWERLWQPAGFIGLGIAGVLTVVVSVVIWTGLVLRHDPHISTPRLSDFIPWRLQ